MTKISESCSDSEFSVKLSSYRRDNILDLRSMQAVPTNRSHVGSPDYDLSKDRETIKIEFYSPSGK